MERRGAALIVRPSGELDMRSAESFGRRVGEAVAEAVAVGGCRRVVLNLRRLTFLDSSGLGAILGLYRHVAEEGGTLAIAQPPPTVRAIIELSGIGGLVPLFPSEEHALGGKEVAGAGG